MTWTHFWDMHSGGSQKESWHDIYIEAPEDEAKVIFYNRFGHNPERVTCTCCGDDYSISEGESLAQLTGFHRNCAFDRELDMYVERKSEDRFMRGEYQTLDTYRQQDDVLVIPADEITEDERIGDVPDQGYVWVG